MLKSVLKEIFIILLLSIAILLILGILLYDYIPINRVIPEREAYVTPAEVENELEENITEAKPLNITYEVTDADLDRYKQTGTYIEGKVNPFELVEETNTVDGNQTGNNNGNGTTEPTNDVNEENNVDKNSTGTFFNEEGIK